jgi:hypothetical protein
MSTKINMIYGIALTDGDIERYLKENNRLTYPEEEENEYSRELADLILNFNFITEFELPASIKCIEIDFDHDNDEK